VNYLNKITLKKINIGDNSIFFNKGMNIITGRNMSGKTLLFNSIMYILGLEKQFPVDKFDFRNLYIDFEVKNIEFRVKRDVGSNKLIFSGGINEEVRVKSDSYYEIYNSILEPSFNFGEDKLAATEILKYSFIPEFKIYSDKTDTIKKILGINVGYLRKSKERIKVFEQEIKDSESSYDMLTTYMLNVREQIHELKNIEDSNIKAFENILNGEYLNIRKKNIEDKNFMKASIEAYKKLEMSCDEKFYKINDKLQNDFQNLCNEIGFMNHYKLENEFLNRRNIKSASLGENRLLQIIITLILSMYSDERYENSTGILAIDGIDYIEASAIYNIRDYVAKKCKENKLQYIEFTCMKEDLPKEWIVHDLNMGGMFNWL
jgi:hypothetical protein